CDGLPVHHADPLCGEQAEAEGSAIARRRRGGVASMGRTALGAASARPGPCPKRESVSSCHPALRTSAPCPPASLRSASVPPRAMGSAIPASAPAALRCRRRASMRRLPPVRPLLLRLAPPRPLRLALPDQGVGGPLA